MRPAPSLALSSFALVLVVGLAAAGCKDDGKDNGDYPVLPGGGGGPFGEGSGSSNVPPTDAPPADDGGMRIAGRACLLTDPRVLTSCAATGAENFLVRLGTFSARTSASGAFTIMAPGGSNFIWTIEDTSDAAVDIATAVQQLGAVNTIPVLSTAMYEQMRAESNATLEPNTGAIIVRVVDGGTPLAGAVVTAAASTSQPALYDGPDSPTGWIGGATGAQGAAWLTSVEPGLVTLRIDPAGAEPAELTVQVPVAANAVTFATFEIP